MFRAVIAATILLCASSCNSVETVAEVDKFDVVPNRKLPTGVAYYLPKNLIRIKFVRTAGSQRGAAQDKIDITVEPAVADTRYRFIVQGVHLPTHDSQFNILISDKGLLSVVTAKVQDRLPEIAANAARFGIAVSAGIPLAPVAPAASRFAELVLDPLSSAAARSEARIEGVDEAAEIGTIPDNGVNMTGEKVVSDAQRCLSELQRVEDSLGALPRGRADARESAARERLEKRRRYLKIVCNCPLSVPVGRPTDATWIIDPARYSSVLSVNCELQKLGSNLRVRVLRWPDARRSYEAHTSDFAPTSHAGVVYRAPTDYKVAIIELRAPVPTEARRAAAAVKSRQRSTQVDLLAIVKEEHNFVLPNGGPIRTLPFRYSMCSVAGYQVQFVDGMPVRQQVDHRSELAACSAIPLQIISDIIEAPINMLDFQTKRLQKEKSLEDARRQLEESRKLPGPGNP